MIHTTTRTKFPTRRFVNKQQADELKRAVRKSVEWKELKELVFNRQDGKDALTGKPLKRGWALHHLNINPDFYDDLDPSHFIAVTPTSHQLIHTLFDNYQTLNFNYLEFLVKNMVKLKEMEWSQ